MRRLAALPLVLLIGAGCDGSVTPGTHADAGTSGTDGGERDGAPPGGSDAGVDAPARPVVLLPRSSIVAAELGVVVNDDDAQSVAVAAYYQAARGIPAENVLHVSLPTGTNVITRDQFAPAKQAVDAATPAAVQAYALTWLQPFRVEKMSITSAFALGFDEKYTSSEVCATTAAVPYAGSESVQPYTDFGIRPTMALAGTSVENVTALIDRGVAADDTFPAGTGYFVRTTDAARSVRWGDMQATAEAWSYPGGLDLQYIDNSDGSGSNVVTGQTDVLFYLTGLATVPEIDTNTYRPGAVADHLTSYGGVLTGGGQMSVLRWLEAGATASCGTVVEPCNYPQKFPAASELVRHYYRGQTVLEAYWKSVAWPGEAIFVGEPLARPFGAATVTFDADRTLTIRLTWLDPTKTYELGAAATTAGPFTPVLSSITIPHHQMAEITLSGADQPVYKLAEAGQL